MSISIYLSLLVCLVGLVVFWFAKNPKWNQVGFAMFQVGLLAFLLQYGGNRTLTLGR